MNNLLCDVLDSDFELSSGSEYGVCLQSDEEDMINDGIDSQVDDLENTDRYAYFCFFYDLYFTMLFR